MDARYPRLPREEIPLTESLKDTVERVLSYWDRTIVPAVRAGEWVLIITSPCRQDNPSAAAVQQPAGGSTGMIQLT